MARPGVTVGDWITHISNTGPNKCLSLRIENAVKDNPFKEHYLECMKAAETGKKEFEKPGKFIECKEMIDNFADEKIKVEFKGHSILFTWE